jgi:transcription elongation factor Elf1
MAQSQFTQSSPQIGEGPNCPKCGAQTWLAHIEPDEPDHDRRTFECPRCQHERTVVVKYA